MKKLAKLFGTIFLVIFFDFIIRFIPEIPYLLTQGSFISTFLFRLTYFTVFVGWFHLILVGIFALFSFLLPNKKIWHIILGSVIAFLAYMLYANMFFLEMQKPRFYPLVITYPIVGGLFGLCFYNIFNKELKPA